jgi:hypothetical protein
MPNFKRLGKVLIVCTFMGMGALAMGSAFIISYEQLSGKTFEIHK